MTGLDADWFGLSDPGTWFGHIVPRTGTGGFAGWSGSARIRHNDQGAYFEIRLASEDDKWMRTWPTRPS